MKLLLECGFQGALSSFCPSSDCEAAGSHCNYKAVGFPDYCRAGEKTGNLTKLNVLIDIQPFFLNYCVSHCCKFLVNFQSSETFILIILPELLHVWNSFTEVSTLPVLWMLLSSLFPLIPRLQIKEDTIMQKVLESDKLPGEGNRA